MNQSELNNIANELRSHFQGSRDFESESALLSRICALSQRQRFWVLTPLLKLHAREILEFVIRANRSQLSLSHYLQIFAATVPRLGWSEVLSVLREALKTDPGPGASALYHIPSLCRRNAQPPALSGPLPTRELSLELIRLIVLYHESGQRVVNDGDLLFLKKVLLNQNEEGVSKSSSDQNSKP